MERGMDGDEMIERDRLLRELDSSFKTIITLVNKAFPSQTSAPTPSVVEPGKTRNNNQEPDVCKKWIDNFRSLAGLKTDFNKLSDTKQLASPISIPSLTTKPKSLNPPPNPTPKPQIPPPISKLKPLIQKLNQIRENRRRGIITCYRCGERNHRATECRNALVCFAYGRLGHRSNTCRAITLNQNHNTAPKPPPNQPISTQIVHTAITPSQYSSTIPKNQSLRMEQIKEANEYPMIRFYNNPANVSLQITLNNSVVITDEHQMGPLYI
jgi:Zinc knuckle